MRFGNVLATQQTPRLDGRRLDLVIPPNAQRGLVDIVLSNSTANEPLRLTDAFLFYSATSSDEIVVDDFDARSAFPLAASRPSTLLVKDLSRIYRGDWAHRMSRWIIDPSLIQCDVMSPEPGTLELALIQPSSMVRFEFSFLKNWF